MLGCDAVYTCKDCQMSRGELINCKFQGVQVEIPMVRAATIRASIRLKDELSSLPLGQAGKPVLRGVPKGAG